MKRVTKLGLVVAAAAMAMPAAASAEVVTFDFSGTYDSGSRAGQAFSGRIQYDRNAAVISSGPGFASYGSLEVTNAANFEAPAQKFVFVGDRSPGNISPDFIIFSNGGDGNFSLGFGADPSFLSSPALPTFAQLAQMNILPSFKFGDSFSTSPILISEVTAAVPEPASWALMLAGFGGIGVAMRRRPTARHSMA